MFRSLKVGILFCSFIFGVTQAALPFPDVFIQGLASCGRQQTYNGVTGYPIFSTDVAGSASSSCGIGATGCWVGFTEYGFSSTADRRVSSFDLAGAKITLNISDIGSVDPNTCATTSNYCSGAGGIVFSRIDLNGNYIDPYDNSGYKFNANGGGCNCPSGGGNDCGKITTVTGGGFTATYQCTYFSCGSVYKIIGVVAPNDGHAYSHVGVNIYDSSSHYYTISSAAPSY